MKCKLLILSFLVSSSLAFAKIELPPMFSNNMVLQQQTEAPIWGKATPLKTVKVVTSWNNETYAVKSDKEGKWKLKVKTPVAGGPYSITISDGKRIKLENIMIGEVWICSGQSNMEMQVEGWGKVNNYQEEIRNADYPDIRFLQVERGKSTSPLSEIKAGSGWMQCSPATVPNFSALAYFFGRKLYQDQNIPVGLISTSVGATAAETWSGTEVIRELPDYDEVMKIIDEGGEAAENLLGNANNPTLLYNAMLYPLIPYSIRGVIWYQGESNVNKSYQYRELFPLLIEGWRRQWKNNFPFYYVQLANFTKKQTEPVESDWAELREAQLNTLRLADTGMAVTIDIGDADDIHAKNKQEVARRLGLIARAKIYGEDVVYSGPIYKDYRIESDKIIISFDHTHGGLKTKGGQSLQGFTIAGADHKFHWANAEIRGSEVVVSSPDVSFPMAVRYAWAQNPVCNLYNGSDLPASPFRTDDWPGVTFGKK